MTSLRSLELDNNGDLIVDGLNNLSLVSDIEELKQRIKLEATTQVGEWFLNEEFGIEWFDNMEEGDTDGIISELETIIEDDEDVETVEVTFDLDSNTRELTIDYTARLVDGSEIRDDINEVV